MTGTKKETVVRLPDLKPGDLVHIPYVNFTFNIGLVLANVPPRLMLGTVHTLLYTREDDEIVLFEQAYVQCTSLGYFLLSQDER